MAVSKDIIFLVSFISLIVLLSISLIVYIQNNSKENCYGGNSGGGCYIEMNVLGFDPIYIQSSRWSKTDNLGHYTITYLPIPTFEQKMADSMNQEQFAFKQIILDSLV